MEELTGLFAPLWQGLIFPLLRLLLVMSCGLLLAGIIEAMHWTRWLARLTAPLTRLGNLGEIAAASFSLAFVSPTSANALLAESIRSGKLTRREVILANIFNSSPSYFMHLPTMLALVVSFLGAPGLIYVGISFLAACLRTLITAVLGRLLLPAPNAACYTGPDCRSDNSEKQVCNGTYGLSPHSVCCSNKAKEQEQEAAALPKTEPVNTATGGISADKPGATRTLLPKIWQRFKLRLRKILLFTVPIYVLIYAMQQLGLFDLARAFLAGNATLLAFLKPEALGIVALSLSAELGAALAAAAALNNSIGAIGAAGMIAGGLEMRDIILALLAGNILSTPIRAFRHQLPSYAGFYAPGLALQLVSINQSLRALTMILLTAIYYWAAW